MRIVKPQTAVEAMIPYLPSDALTMLFGLMVGELYTTKYHHEAAVGWLTIISLRLAPNILIVWIDPISKKLHNKVGGHAVLKYLTAIRLRVTLDTLVMWFDLLVRTLQDNKTPVQYATLECLTVISSQLPLDILATWINPVIGMLQHHNHNDVQEAAITCLMAMSLKLAPDMFNQATDLIINLLDDNDWTICCTALKYLTCMSLNVTSNTLTTWIDPVLGTLLEHDRYIDHRIFEARLECLTAMIPRLTADTLVLLFDLMVNRLKNSNDKTCQTALTFLTVMSPKIPSNTLAISIKLVLELLKDNYYVRQTALSYLTAIIGYLKTH